MKKIKMKIEYKNFNPQSFELKPYELINPQKNDSLY